MKANRSEQAKVANSATGGIIRDIIDRSGLCDVWASIDGTTKREIKSEWRMIIGHAIADVVNNKTED